MKLEKTLQFSLTEEEIKEAIIDFLLKKKIKKEYIKHLKNSSTILDSTYDEYILIVDGAIEEKV